jgi:hypothetical protein
MDRPIVFLDIDGVLNSHDYVKRGGSLSCRNDGIDPQAVTQLQRIIDETDCSIVLSSTWRLIHSLSHMRSRLYCAGAKHPVPLRDKTPDLSPRGGQVERYQRGLEVNAWINNIGFEGKFVCLDDDADFLPGQPLVQTTFETGLTEAHADRCISILCPRSAA